MATTTAEMYTPRRDINGPKCVCGKYGNFAEKSGKTAEKFGVSIEYWEAMGLTGYDARHEYCSLQGHDLDQDSPLWEATTDLMTMRTKTLHRVIDLSFKLTSELFDMGRFPSHDRCPWEKLIRVQHLAVAIQQRLVAAKDSIELVLEASKKAIQGNIEMLWTHETLMRNFLDMFERSIFSPTG